MEIGKLYQRVFGEQIIQEDDLQISECTAHLQNWLKTKLIDAENTCITDPEQEGRLGPEKVVFDASHEVTLRVSDDYLTVQSQGTFSTIKANVCVFSGKWMYEIQLLSKGVMQIGFCSNRCSFSMDTGVGDTNFSYGFDGSKQQIWHVSTSKYGQAWQTGDIIGVCLDIDCRTITYYRNGESMGVAFTDIERNHGLALFPAISLAFNEEICGNFGGTPFRYPVDGYQPLQAKPIVELQKSEILLSYLMNIAGAISRPKYRKTEKRLKDGKSSKNATYISVAAQIIDNLVPHLMNAYVIEDKLYNYMKNLCVLRSETDKDAVIIPGSEDSTLGTLLTVFWTCLEEFEMHFVLNKLFDMLVRWYLQTSKDLEYERQRKVIVLLTCMCNHPKTRKYFLENCFFNKNNLPNLLYLRPPEYSTMVQILPDENVWTRGLDGSKGHYFEACKVLKASTETLYTLQRNLLKTLLSNDDGDLTSASSRKIFIVKLRKYVMDNSLEHRAFFLLQSSNYSPTESPIALSFACILIDITKELFQSECSRNEVQINPRYFFDGSFKYNHFDRVGGVLSHLRKVNKTLLDAYLGQNNEQELQYYETATDSMVSTSRSETNDVYQHIILLAGAFNGFSVIGRTSTGLQDARIIPGNVNQEGSLNELLDMCILYYYSVGHKHVLKIASVRDEIEGLNEVLIETTQHREDIRKNLEALKNSAGTSFNEINNEILREIDCRFGQRSNVFAKRSIELGRKQAWYRAVALGKHRKELLIWLLDDIIRTLKTCSDLGLLFSFVPEVYINVLPLLLDSIIDFSIHDISAQFDLSDVEPLIKESAEFLGKHAADPRIALAACKDSLLHALGTIITHDAGIKTMEQSSFESQSKLIRALLRPYENRAWGQSNWLLLRLWLGHGFAYREARLPSVWQGGSTSISLGLSRSRGKNESHTGLLHHVAPACPSKHFQVFIANLLRDDEPFATAFLNSVLSQLNWAFSEFILLLQELQNISNRQETEPFFEPRQLKICSMCFELTVSLMRCLEMIITIAPFVYEDPARPNSDLILNRICQLISQVLSRVTVPPGCFQFVVDLCLPDLSSITHFSIIAAALGILIALLKDEIENIDTKPQSITRITKALLTDPSFQIANLEFALGEVKTPILTQKDIPRGNFDPKMRAHIDPITNDVRVGVPSTSKPIRVDPPVFKFSLKDYPSHVSQSEIEQVEKLIKLLQIKQTLLSDITLPSEDSLCPICCAKPVAVEFMPCKHQSCSNCILQHLMNSKVCFYCKVLIKYVKTFEGKVLFENQNYVTFENVTGN